MWLVAVAVFVAVAFLYFVVVRGAPKKSKAEFVKSYGPWAVVAGASEGIGLSFCCKIAAQGFTGIVLIARNESKLIRAADYLERKYKIKTRVLAVDLTDEDAVKKVTAKTSRLNVGLFVFNAAYSQIGQFVNVDLDTHIKTVDCNIVSVLRFVHYFANRFVDRGSGGIILLSSLSGFWGSELVIR